MHAGALPSLRLFNIEVGVVFLLVSSSLAPTPCIGGSAHFETTGSLTIGRADHTATFLPEGKVLVVDGEGTTVTNLPSAELYDPATHTWSATTTPAIARVGHTATLLPNGKVLIAGGSPAEFQTTASAELYDPTTGIWTMTGSLAEARAGHSATLLPSGKVLVVGGLHDDDLGASMSLASAELYDPESGTWTRTGSLATSRFFHSAMLLRDGSVLVAGGQIFILGVAIHVLDSAELYDPETGTWTSTGSLVTAREEHTATRFANGNVLVAGGVNSDTLASAELYDPGTKSWSVTATMNNARVGDTATLLPDGTVLVTGGSAGNSFLASAEIYDPDEQSWALKGGLITARTGHSATLLADSSVLIAGGFVGSPTATATAELYVRAALLLNISTRLDVELGQNVMIGGFIVTGTTPQTVIVRGLGPSLTVTGALSDPIIELHDSTGALLATNDNWKDDPNQQQVINGGLAPSSELESALWRVIDPGAYTVILKGTNNGTGVGLVEVYQVGQGNDANLANISTRGLVQTDDNVLIGGLIVGGGTGDGSANVLIRALGPSLPLAGVLANPTLELHDGSGTLVDSNDDWKTRPDGTSQEAEIEATTIPPNNDLESALVETLSPGNYTAIVRGKDNGIGIGMVEVYNLP